MYSHYYGRYVRCIVIIMVDNGRCIVIIMVDNGRFAFSESSL